MKSSGTRYVPGYDLFKLIVAVILTIILILLLLAEKQSQFEELSLLLTATERVALATPTAQPSLTPLPTISFQQTVTPDPTNTIEEPTATATVVEQPTPTQTQVVQEPAPTQQVEASDPNGCPSNPTQLEVNNEVVTNDWLNFRTGPGLHYEIQHTNRPGTNMEVIGGPVCTVRDGDPPRAYLWWNVRMEDGQEGWSAEAPLNFPNYFIEPTE